MLWARLMDSTYSELIFGMRERHEEESVDCELLFVVIMNRTLLVAGDHLDQRSHPILLGFVWRGESKDRDI